MTDLLVPVGQKRASCGADIPLDVYVALDAGKNELILLTPTTV